MKPPLEIAIRLIDSAVEIAPADPEPLIAYWLNQLHAPSRLPVANQVNEVIDRKRMLKRGDVALRPLESFSYVDADDLFAGLMENAPREENGAAHSMRNRLSSAFAPHEENFLPHYFPQPWCSALDAIPMSPAAVRVALALSGEEVAALVRDIKHLLQHKARSVVRGPRSIGARAHDDQPSLRVAVAPFADTLSLPALLYAVSDQVGVALDFLPATFFKESPSDPQGAKYLGGVGNFDIGYCIKQDLQALQPKSMVHQIFDGGITRSILLRFNRDEASFIERFPQVLHFSMLGELGPNKNNMFTLDASTTESAALRISHSKKLSIPDDLVASDVFHPNSNWELSLILAMASANSHRVASVSESLLGLTISTDAHIWACHSGLIYPDVDARDQSPFGPSTGKLLPLRLVRAAWQPGESEGSEVDRNAQLCWYAPKHPDGALRNQIEERWSRLVRERLRTPFDKLSVADLVNFEAGVVRHNALAEGRQAVRETCRAIMAPLLKTLPTYRGAIWHSPPEAWTRKLFGPNDHLYYQPYWYVALRTAQEHGGLSLRDTGS